MYLAIITLLIGVYSIVSEFYEMENFKSKGNFEKKEIISTGIYFKIKIVFGIFSLFISLLLFLEYMLL